MTNLVGNLKGYGPVWYDPYGIANILSFKRVREKYEVQYESNERSFVVTKPDSMMFKFVESPEGLHYLDTEGDSGMTLVNTVANNWSNYSNQDYLRAVQARELQIEIGRPSLWEYIRMVSDNLLPDCPVTKADIMAAEDIFGPEVGGLKGKSTRRNPHAVKQVVEPLEPSIMKHYRKCDAGGRCDVRKWHRLPGYSVSAY